jgi:HEAT repeat protein
MYTANYHARVCILLAAVLAGERTFAQETAKDPAKSSAGVQPQRPSEGPQGPSFEVPKFDGGKAPTRKRKFDPTLPQEPVALDDLLLQRLRSTDLQQQLSAVDSIARLGPKGQAYSGELERILREKNAAANVDRGAQLFIVRKPVGVALGKLGAVKELVAALDDDEAGVLMAACAGLQVAAEKAKPALPRLATLLKHENRALRVAAILAVASIQPEHAGLREALASILGDDKAESFVRVSLLQGLAAMQERSRAALPVLKALLKDADLTLRAAAIVAVGSIAPDDVSWVEALSAYMKDPKADAAARFEMLKGVGMLGSRGKGALPAVKSLKSDTDVRVRFAVVPTIMLLDIDDRSWPLRAAAFITDAHNDVTWRQHLVGTLGQPVARKRAAEAVRILIRALDDTGLKFAPLASLARLGPAAEAAVPKLAAMLKPEGRLVVPDPLPGPELLAIGTALHEIATPGARAVMRLTYEAVVWRRGADLMEGIPPNPVHEQFAQRFFE